MRREHFFLPERYTDPFGNVTEMAFDPRDLFVESSTDALRQRGRGSSTSISACWRRATMQDINDNVTRVAFDVAGHAGRGRRWESRRRHSSLA